MRRGLVVGAAGSGKTTFAHRLAALTGVPRIELDALNWGPGWAAVELAVFRERVTAATAGDTWVVDGNYSVVRDIYLNRADTIVWLDLPLSTCLIRVIRRTARRARAGEELWGTGNRESWRKLFGRDSLVWWVLTTHRRRRRELGALCAEAALAAVDVHRFASSAAADAWLVALGEAAAPTS
ncbi:MAG: adenylate kinase [Chloroflexi bacterium]|nr:adenylate kinase [Chloroflexota bacterium]